MIDFELKREFWGDVSIEDADTHEEFIRGLNWLIDEGFLEVEEGDDGEIRLYSTS